MEDAWMGADERSPDGTGTIVVEVEGWAVDPGADRVYADPALRTLIVAGGGKPADETIRALIDSDDIPDVLSAESAIGGVFIDDRYFAALASRRGRRLARLPLAIAQAIEVRRIGADFDAVLTWGDRPSLVIATAMLGQRQRPAHVAILMWPSRLTKALPLALLQRRIDRFIAWPPLQRRFLEQGLGIATDRFTDAQGRVDTRYWRPIKRQTNMICSVGQEMRDYGTLLAAIAGTGIRCHIAPGSTVFGTTRDDWWRHSIDERKLPVELTVEAKSLTALRELYASSRFVVVPLHPSDMDNGINAILEAFAMGKAVICTDTAGQVGVLDDGVNCIRVPPHDPEALREAIVELWADPERCERLGAAGRTLVERDHSIDRWTRSLRNAVDAAVMARCGGRAFKG